MAIATANPATKPAGPSHVVASLVSSQAPTTPGRNIVRPIAMMRAAQPIASPIEDSSRR
jgi:hypothetical protein